MARQVHRGEHSSYLHWEPNKTPGSRGHDRVGQFQLEPMNDLEFWHVFEESLVCCNRELLWPDQVSQKACFEAREDLLYRIDKEKGQKAKVAQLLVPQYRMPLIKLMHDRPMGGHPGQDKTKAHLIQQFSGLACVKKSAATVRHAWFVRSSWPKNH